MSLERLLRREDLNQEEAQALMASVLADPEPVRVAAILTALAIKGETATEIAGFAAAMRAEMQAVTVDGPVLDTCGTGGSGLPTLNTSTLAAFVAASAGVRVAKHGNRASSGKCGSMDVLEALGVVIELTPERAQGLLIGGSFVFLNARRHHPALGPLGPVRRALGFRTVFNFLGPICNPARATHQLVGVSDEARAPVLLDSLVKLGAERAMVVAAHDNLDEISLCGPTQLWRAIDGSVEHQTLHPADFGLDAVAFADIAGGEVEDNVNGFLAVLSGQDAGPRHLHTALNAGAALYVAGKVGSVKDGIELARNQLRSGAALRTFEAYRDASQGA